MALPKGGAAPERYHRAGVHMEAMLDLEPDTRDLVLSIQEPNQNILTLIRQDEDLQINIVKSYARLLWADNKLDHVVRDLSADLKKADRSQPALQGHDKFFPEGGFSGLIQPSGRVVDTQINTLRKRLPILDGLKSKAPEIDVYTQRLEDACQLAEQALATLKEYDDLSAQLKVQFDLAIEAWRTAAYQIEGELFKRFPGRKDIVRDFFYSPSKSTPSKNKAPAPTPSSTTSPVST